MNLNDLKLSGTNLIEVNDSLETSLLSLKISINENTVIPDSNELTIYVDTNSIPTEGRKTYTFSLQEKLSVGDVFIMEPTIKNKKVELKAYIKRATNEIEDLEYQDISLFAGINYIYTNYENATIDIIYPKNIDFVKYYLNNIIYALNNDNKIISLDDIYFKDAFTKVDDNINASFNNLSIDCLSSNNNKFNLDSDGNLTVNSITTSISSSETNFDEIYPIGSIYMSVNNTNPSTLFGGTWSQIAQGRTLVGVDTNDQDFNAVKKTGGSKFLQQHSHKQSLSDSGSRINVAGYDWTVSNTGRWYEGNDLAGEVLANIQTGNSGNLQPYLTVYIWERIA